MGWLSDKLFRKRKRLNPKKIVVVSSAPQIRYPDCYGIDMARIDAFIAFKAALELLKETNQYHIIDDVYKRCKAQQSKEDDKIINYFNGNVSGKHFDSDRVHFGGRAARTYVNQQMANTCCFEIQYVRGLSQESMHHRLHYSCSM